MVKPEDCEDYLRTLILKADREDIGSAQKSMLEYAVSFPDAQGRLLALDALLVGLKSWEEQASLSELQHAFAVVTVAMIERTRLMIGPQDGSLT